MIGVTDFNFQEFALLIFGGFLVTGSANGFNQVLEKDYDKLMTRTHDRPLPQKEEDKNNLCCFYFLYLLAY